MPYYKQRGVVMLSIEQNDIKAYNVIYTFFFIRTLKMELGLMFLAYQGFRALKCSEHK